MRSLIVEEIGSILDSVSSHSEVSFFGVEL